jgi:3-carboxy-cis,cis-muconate cycloisomerase
MPAFIDRDYLQSLLDVEAALAAAEAEVGVIPASCLADIRAAARSEFFDLASLSAEAARHGNVVIPLVRELTAAVARRNPESARYVHRGATSQDIMDTAWVLRLRDARGRLLQHLAEVMQAAAAHARAHAATPIAGRTWLQQASPTTFGLKAAGWLDLIGRCRERVDMAIERALVIQLGGASGTLAALGASGQGVAEALARKLSLTVPDLPWHTHRDRVADVGAALALACGALGKIGRDVTLLAQTEVGEVSEPADGGGGSSSMPHKQNPVRAVSAVAAATRAPGLAATLFAAMPQEHERAAGGWQAEWQTLEDLLQLTLESSSAVASALKGLQIHAGRMRANLQCAGGVAMAESLSVALQSRLGGQEAMALVTRLAGEAGQQGAPLRDIAVRDEALGRVLTRDQIEQALAPENFLGAAGEFVSLALRRWKA